MDERELPPFFLHGEQRPLAPYVYRCVSCDTDKVRYEPYPPREPGNTDHRQYCWKCRQIKQHLRIPPAREP